MGRVLKPLFSLVAAAALCAAISACNTNGGIPAAPFPPGGSPSPFPTAEPTPTAAPTPTKKPTPSPSPSPTTTP